MAAIKFNIDVQRGKTKRLEFQYFFKDPDDLDEEGNPKEKPVDLTGVNVVFRAHWAVHGLLEVSSAIDPLRVVVDALNGGIKIKLLPAQTDDMTVGNGNFEVDLEQGEDIDTIIYGDMRVTDWIPNA